MSMRRAKEMLFIMSYEDYMAALNPFNPGVTITLSVTTSSGTGSVTGGAETLEIQNAGSAIAFVRVGSSASTVTATTADYPILPGMSKIIWKGSGPDTIAAIGAGATTLYVTSGSGT